MVDRFAPGWAHAYHEASGYQRVKPCSMSNRCASGESFGNHRFEQLPRDALASDAALPVYFSWRSPALSQARRNANAQPPIYKTLPVALTSFVGRTRELVDVVHLLASARLVSLVGAGGSGKTRLALRVANDIADQFADGVCWVELDRLGDPALVTQAVAKALNIVEQPDAPLLDALLERMRTKQMLLVLDNCEHMLAACTQLAEVLLRGSAVTILATSREPLGVEGEMIYPAPPLALPAAHLPIAEIGRYDAIRLFVERARSVRHDFALTPDNAAAITEICQRLDGVPLAIELASARVSVLTVQQVAERLDSRLDLLISSVRPDERHRTLRATIDWSYDLLSPAEQRLLQRLSVFASGFTLTMAESACAFGDIQHAEVLDLLASLVSKSLVAAETLQGSEARYRLLETIRQYAQQKLKSSGDWEAAHTCYLEWFLRLTEEVAPKLREPYLQLWFNWLEAEHDNIRAALAWALERGRIEAGLRIGVVLGLFWQTRAYFHEGNSWLERFLSRADDGVPIAVRANALVWASFLAEFSGDTVTATAHGQEAVALCEAAGDEGKSLLPFALAGLMVGTNAIGDHQTSFVLGERAIAAWRERDEPYSLGVQLLNQGEMAIALEKYEAANALLNECLSLARQADDPYRIAATLNDLGDLARCEGRFDQAKSLFAQSLTIWRELGSVREVPMAMHNMAAVVLRQGDVERAQELFRESLETHRAQRNREGILRGLLGFAALASTMGLAFESARLYAAVAAHSRPNSAIRWPPEKFDYERYIGQARQALSDAAFEAAQTSGRAMSVEQAVEHALGLSLSDSTRPSDLAASSDLSAREREIAVLIAGGLSNGDIATKLVLSKRTVEKHVANILSKLGLTNRAQIVRWTMDHGVTL